MDMLKYLAFQSSSDVLLCALKWGVTVRLAYKIQFQKIQTQTWVLKLYFITYWRG